MNTQRPEWNDANNALAGYGLSMVTACQLRRHVALLREIYRESAGPWSMSTSVASWAELSHRTDENTGDDKRGQQAQTGKERRW